MSSGAFSTVYLHICLLNHWYLKLKSLTFNVQCHLKFFREIAFKRKEDERKKRGKVEVTDSLIARSNKTRFCRKTLISYCFPPVLPWGCHSTFAVIAFPSMSSAGHGSGHKHSNPIPIFSLSRGQLWWLESTCLLLTKAVM